MTILKTQSGLLLYSPVALNAEHVASIRALGKVTDIVAPNLFHHMYLRPCVAAFPDANCWVPEGLLEKIGPVDGAQIITPDIIFGNDDNIKKFTLTGHRIQETMIFHEPSRTLLTADLLYNYQSEQYSWPINRIIMSHGRIVETTDASTIFADAWKNFAK